jgi:hypothetical protein
MGDGVRLNSDLRPISICRKFGELAFRPFLAQVA